MQYQAASWIDASSIITYTYSNSALIPLSLSVAVSVAMIVSTGLSSRILTATSSPANTGALSLMSTMLTLTSAVSKWLDSGSSTRTVNVKTWLVCASKSNCWKQRHVAY